LAWLKKANMVGQQEYEGAEDSLKWAARTYVVAAIGALASLIYMGNAGFWFQKINLFK
jgi:Zn-dependent membrane protease YugP